MVFARFPCNQTQKTLPVTSPAPTKEGESYEEKELERENRSVGYGEALINEEKCIVPVS